MLLVFVLLLIAKNPFPPDQLFQLSRPYVQDYSSLKFSTNLALNDGKILWNKQDRKVIWQGKDIALNHKSGQATIEELTAVLDYGYQYVGFLHLESLRLIKPVVTLEKQESASSKSISTTLPKLAIEQGKIIRDSHVLTIQEATYENNALSIEATYQKPGITLPFEFSGQIDEQQTLSGQFKTAALNYEHYNIPALEGIIASATQNPLNASIIELEQPIKGKISLTATNITGNINRLTIQMLESVVGKEAKEIVKTIPSGTLSKINFIIPREQKIEKGFSLEAQLANSQINYSKQLPPLKNFSGQLSKTGDVYTLTGKGTIEKLPLLLEKVTIQDSNTTAAVIVEGSLKEQIALARQVPEVKKALQPLNIAGLSGSARTIINYNNGAVEVAAQVTQATLPIPETDLALKSFDGSLTVDAEQNFNLSGTGQLNKIPVIVTATAKEQIIETQQPVAVDNLLTLANVTNLVPYVKGKASFKAKNTTSLEINVSLDESAIELPQLNWQKPLGQSATLLVKGDDKKILRFESLETTVNAVIDKTIEIQDSVIGSNIINRLSINGKQINIDAQYLDVSHLLKESSSDNDNTYQLNGSVEALRLTEALMLKNARFKQNGVLKLTATLAGSTLDLTYDNSNLILKASKAGSFLKAAGITEHLIDGDLYFNGTTKDSLKGQLKITISFGKNAIVGKNFGRRVYNRTTGITKRKRYCLSKICRRC